MKAAIQAGLFTLNATLNSTPPVCATGNCSWQPYRSLAVCTRWQDISSHVKLEETVNEEDDSKFVLWSLNDRSFVERGAYPERCQLNMTSVATPKPVDEYADLPNALHFDDSIAFKDSKWPLADVFIVYENSSSMREAEFHFGGRFSAMEFVLEWCVQEFNTTVVNGTTVTTRLNSTNAFDAKGSSLNGPMTNVDDDGSWSVKADRYNVDKDTHYILANYLRKFFDGSVAQQGPDMYKTSDAAEAFWLNLFAGVLPDMRPSETKIRAGISQVLQNIATSMTNV
jgi:hypothetical protein